MQKVFKLRNLTIVILAIILPNISQAEELKLVSDSKPTAKIVLPDKPVKAEKLAAEELNEHIALITGTRLPVIQEKNAGAGPNIYLGKTRKAAQNRLDPQKFKEQEYAIKFIPDGILIIGRDKTDQGTFKYRFTDKKSGLQYYDCRTWPDWWDEKGTLDAVYYFLKNYCGVRWFDYTDLGTDATPSKSLAVKRTDIKRQPSFFMRNVFTTRNPADYPAACLLWIKKSDNYKKYMQSAFATIATKDPKLSSRSSRSLISNQVYAYLLRNGNGGTGFFHPNHSFYDYYARFWKKDKRFPSAFESEKKEYFAQGYPADKNPPQLCYTNPELIDQVCKDASNWFEKKPFGLYKFSSRGKNKWRQLQQIAADYYPLVPMDNRSYCKCPECRKWYKPYTGDTYAENKGMYSNYVFNFVNQVAKRIKKQYPDKKIGALAYAMYMDVPDKVKLEDNIMVMFCPVLRNVYSESRQEADREMLSRWAKTGVPLYLWLYYCFPAERSIRTGGKWHVFPGFFAHHLAKSFKEYRKYNCKGMYFNGFGQEVEAFVTYELLSDADRSADELLDEYFNRMYGPAGPALRKLYCRIEKIYCNPQNYPKFVQDRSRQNEEVAWGLLGNHERMKELAALIRESREKIKEANELQQKRFKLFDISTLQYIEEGRRRYLTKRGKPKKIFRISCAPLLESPESGNSELINWQDAQGLNLWTSNYNEPVASDIQSQVAHDNKYLYLRLSDSDLKKNAVGSWQIMFIRRSGKEFVLDKMVTVDADGKMQGPEKLIKHIKSSLKGDNWTLTAAFPLSALTVKRDTIYLNAARLIPGSAPAVLAPTMGKPELPSAFVVINLEQNNPKAATGVSTVPLAKYDFNAVSLKDLKGIKLNSTAPRLRPGPFGNALELDRRIGCEYFDISLPKTASGNYTFSAWAKVNTVPISGKLSCTLLASKNVYLAIKDYEVSVTQVKPKMRLKSDRLITPEQWENIVLTTNSSGTKLYINGRLAGSSGTKLNVKTDSKLRIGAEWKLQHHRQFRGQLDEINIYGRALTTEEIITQYRSGLQKIQNWRKK